MKLTLDRINRDENGKIVACFEGDDGMILIKEDDMPKDLVNQLFENAIIECDYANGKITSAVVLTEETKNREEKMREKFSRILSKRKKG